MTDVSDIPVPTGLFEVVDRYNARHRFDRAKGFWFEWNGGHLEVFKEDAEGDFELFATFPNPAVVGVVTEDDCLALPMRELSLARCSRCGFTTPPEHPPEPINQNKDALLYRWWKQNREVTLVTAIFGNGCINKTIDDVEKFILGSSAPMPPEPDRNCNKDCFNECDHHCPPCPSAAVHEGSTASSLGEPEGSDLVTRLYGLANGEHTDLLVAEEGAECIEELGALEREHYTEIGRLTLELAAPMPPEPTVSQQDALDWLAVHASFGVDSITGELGGNGQAHLAATRKNIEKFILSRPGEVTK